MVDIELMINCCITGIGCFTICGYVSYWMFNSVLCRLLSSIRNLLFLRKCTRQQCIYLHNATTAVQYQSSQLKFSLLQATPKHCFFAETFRSFVSQL